MQNFYNPNNTNNWILHLMRVKGWFWTNFKKRVYIFFLRNLFYFPILRSIMFRKRICYKKCKVLIFSLDKKYIWKTKLLHPVQSCAFLVVVEIFGNKSVLWAIHSASGSWADPVRSQSPPEPQSICRRMIKQRSRVLADSRISV